MNWRERLERAVVDKGSLLCVGLDTDMTRMPDDLKRGELPQLEINRAIVEHTREYAVAYKPNMAFYEAEGTQGIKALEATVRMILNEAPEATVIIDAKRGDIGNTSKAYARAIFGRMGAHAVTLNPYMGKDVVEPFLEYDGSLVFLLCRTSNRSAGAVQDLEVRGDPFFLRMADLAVNWNEGDSIGLVVGATSPGEMMSIRKRVGPDMPFLVPGIGAQGGDLRETLRSGTDRRGYGAVINSSRGIMFAFERSGGPRQLGPAAGAEAERLVSRMREELSSLGRW